MALSAATVWEVRSDGSDNNGGGYKTGASGTDYTQQAAAQKGSTDLAIHASDNTKVQPVAAGVAAADIGNIVQITAGSGFTTGFYEITAQDGTYWTLDRAAGTVGSTGGTYAMGGALATLPKIAGTTPVAISGNTIYLKNGTYTLTSTWTIGVDGDVTNGDVWIVGYNTTRTRTNTDATRPLITSATNSVVLLSMTAINYLRVVNVHFTHTAVTRGIGISGVTTAGIKLTILRCLFDGCSQAMDFGSRGCTPLGVYFCEIKNCTSTGGAIGIGDNTVVSVAYCYIHDNAGIGIGGAASSLVRCLIAGNIFDTNSYGIRDTTTTRAQTYDIIGNTFYNSTNDHIELDGSGSGGSMSLNITNNIFYTCGGYDVQVLDGANETNALVHHVNYNAYNSGSSGIYSNLNTGPNDVTLTGNPFVDAANGNFALNTTAGAGAAARAVAAPGLFPGGLTQSYLDIGAVQHADPVGGGGGLLAHAGMSGGLNG